MVEPRSLHRTVGYLLGQATHALSKDFDAQVRAAGLSAIEWRVLATLCEAGPLTITQLAREVLAKQPTLTKLAQRMGEQGWLVLNTDPADQRRTVVEATRAGRRLATPLIERERAHESDRLRALGAGERTALKKLLVKLTRGSA